MESIILISKGVSLATAYSRLCSSKRVESLLNENNRLTSSIHKMVDAEGNSTLLDAVNLLNGAQSASQDKVSFYLENAYLKFLHSYNYYKTLFDNEFNYAKKHWRSYEYNNGEETINMLLENISTALNGCYICSYFLKNYKDAISYLDLSLHYDPKLLMFFYVVEYLTLTENVLRFKILSNNKYSFIEEFSQECDCFRIMKNMVEIAIEEKLRITKECKYFFLVYEQNRLDEIDASEINSVVKLKRIFDDCIELKYIIDNKQVIDN